MNTAKLLNILLCLSLLTGCATSELSINIIDSKTKEPITEAYVYVDNNLHLSDSSGNVKANSDDSRIDIYVGKDKYFPKGKTINTSTNPTRNGVIYTTVELYDCSTNNSKNRSRLVSFSPSEYFTDSYIENTPNIKEFLTYLLNANVIVYNFSANPNFKNFIVNARCYDSKKPIANCYVLATKRATLFSRQKDYLYMTNQEGYIDIDVKDFDRIFLAKDGYDYAHHSIINREQRKELNIYLRKDFPKNFFYISDAYIQISSELLSEYKTNKMLQNFLEIVKKQNVIISKLPENEIVDVDKDFE